MKPNAEGNLYEVRWKKVPSGYSAWLNCVPKLKVNGKDQEELSDLLFEITMDRFGDGEPCFEFDPPFPPQSAEQRYFNPEWFGLASNEHFRTLGDSAPLFSEGLCSNCGAGMGKRTSAPRVLDGVPRSDFAFIWQAQPSAYIASENFVKFCRPLLRSRLRIVPCWPARKTQRQFFELDLAPELPLEVHKQATTTFGVICPSCKSEYGGYFACPEIGKGLWAAVERDKLTSLNRKVVVASRGMNRRICVNSQIAQRLKMSRGLRGLLLERLVMLEAKQLGKFRLAKADKKQK